MIDLHTHSTASDGSFGPEALIEEAAGKGLTALALTDHDTLDGLEEAGKAAARRGLNFIPGVELQINWKNAFFGGPNSNQQFMGEFHLLGLGIRRPSADFLKALEELRHLREKRNLKIVARMNGLGIETSYDEILALSGGKIVGRPHFGSLLISKNIVKNQKQAFARYLSPGKPLYAAKAGLEFEKAAALIKESGGIAVMAHPMSLYISWGRLPELMKNLKERGLDGIEAWHPTARYNSCARLEGLGRGLGLIITAGSDFHGETRPDRSLGISAGGKIIDESFLEAIPALQGR
jgi:predicted metal-dependent phosphoesterase TrpH